MKNIQSTALPDERPTFNIWANGIYSKPDPWKIKSSFTNKNTMKEPNELRRQLIEILSTISDDYSGTIDALETLIRTDRINFLDKYLKSVEETNKTLRTLLNK